MPDFHRASEDRINVFHVGEQYLFKQYFDEETIFSTLRQFYNPKEYRFEVPSGAFEEIRTFLQDFGFALVVVSEIEEFTVVVRKYTQHPESIFKDAVMRQSVPDYHIFVLTNHLAVEQAVTQGASRLHDVGLSVSFEPN